MSIDPTITTVGRSRKKSMGDSESNRNLFEQVGQEKGKLTMNDLCPSVIAPPLMEKIQYLPNEIIADLFHQW